MDNFSQATTTVVHPAGIPEDLQLSSILHDCNLKTQPPMADSTLFFNPSLIEERKETNYLKGNNSAVRIKLYY
jgi:hypothetical protein